MDIKEIEIKCINDNFFIYDYCLYCLSIKYPEETFLIEWIKSYQQYHFGA